MSKQQKRIVDVSPDVKILEAQVRAYFANMQTIYNAAQKANTAEDIAIFMSKATNINNLRSEYMKLVKELNVARLSDDPLYEPNFQSLIAFEELFSSVQYKLNENTPSSSAKNSTELLLPTESKPKIKLPPITLPKFNGETKHWTIFYECYNNIVHNNKSLSDSEKLHYLLGQLSGTALTAIAGIEPTGGNYTLIYSTLVEKYQDIRALGYSYLDQLFNFKQLQSSQNLNSFIDICATSIAAFEKLDIPNKADFIYLYLALKKIDRETARLYENHMRSEKLPSFENFIKFIKEQAKINERTPASSSHTQIATQRKIPTPKNITPTFSTKTFAAVNTNEILCPLCNSDTHKQFYRCPNFLKLTPQERYNIVKAHKACTSCLSFFHQYRFCKSEKSCGSCGSKFHHSLLHTTYKTDEPSTHKGESTPADSDKNSQSQKVLSLCSLDNATPRHTTVLLATACVRALDYNGTEYNLKCLIDNASQHNYITSDCVKRLGLNLESLPHPSTVTGFGGESSEIKGISRITIFSRFNSKSYYLSPLIVDKITDHLPTSPVDNSLLTYLTSVPLADNTYHLPSKIDMILGAQMFTQILLSGRVFGPPGMPQALQTTLGFILMGDAPLAQPTCPPQTQTLCAITNERLDKTLRIFFELEDIPSSKNNFLSIEEQECEDIYKNTTERDAQGRYIVALPFKSDPSVLGNASLNAEKRFNYLERKLESSPALRDSYNNIIDEYLEKDYLSPVTQLDSDVQYVIPHHGVQRNDKTTTKLRLVLDASAAAKNNISLNQLLHKGPNLQSDLFMLLINFRLFKIAICADIKQMYLQLKVHPEFWKFQRIFYRFCKSNPLQLFQFKRVCFGLASSPFLALRTLKQLAEDEGNTHPLAADVINAGQFYMDDIICSTHTVEDAVELADQLSKMFASGCFDLLKWSSNSADFLSNYPEELLHPSIAINFEPESSQKVLGVKWEPHKDVFTFDFSPKEVKCTKRNMLSVIAQLFDVLGFVAPVILFAKLLIKELWLLKIDWDDEPPAHVKQSWLKFQSELHILSQISVPRHVGITQNCEVTLVAFSDASEKAYGAVLYTHTKTPNGNVISLLCAKSKVAPVKTVSLARLELCAAYMLSKLVRAVLTNYGSRIIVARIYAFSDSTVTLNWINSSPHKLKTFIANRVSKIQNNLAPENFFHVSGNENPSDCLSRGLTPAQLASHTLWFSGPTWLSKDCEDWPVKQFIPNLNDLPETKTLVLNTVIPEKQLILTIAERTSNWMKLVRIFVYILRFSKRLNTRGLITADDLNASELFIIRSLQEIYFSEYIDALKKNIVLPKTIRKLRPILVDGVIRVGGRLSACTEISFDHKHPILLPSKDHVVNLIIEHVHRISCHAGPQTTLSLLRKKYWILSARRVVRSRIHACVPCFKARPIPYQAPVMADLPSCRLDISKPFAHTGIDYCGPFFITLTRGRGIKSRKAYVCVFICLSTRAVHVEIAPDLTTDAFLNCFKRFLSRRGPVQRIWTDHGSTPLTPAHFLNITPLKALPAVDVTHEKSHLISRFSLLDKLVQSYWKRWREEYLHTLQTRSKWSTESRPVEIGAIVLINQNCAPLHWPVGRVEKLYPGPDGRIRVASVRTKSGTLTRPVVRLCPLPIF